MSRVQGVIDPNDRAYPEQYRRMSEAVNTKSRSIVSAHIQTVVVGAVLVRHVVVNTTVFVINLSATAQVAGAGGTNGITLRFAGGSANLDVYILPVAATSTDLSQSSFSNYEVPDGNTFTVTLQADDHVTPPEVVRVCIGIRSL